MPSYPYPGTVQLSTRFSNRPISPVFTSALTAGVLGHPIVLLETFVDPQRHRGTLYQAANWLYVGDSRGYRRRTSGYSPRVHSPKKIFLRGLRPQARALLCQAHLAAPYVAGEHEHTLA